MILYNDIYPLLLDIYVLQLYSICFFITTYFTKIVGGYGGGNFNLSDLRDYAKADKTKDPL